MGGGGGARGGISCCGQEAALRGVAMRCMCAKAAGDAAAAYFSLHSFTLDHRTHTIKTPNPPSTSTAQSPRRHICAPCSCSMVAVDVRLFSSACDSAVQPCGVVTSTVNVINMVVDRIVVVVIIIFMIITSLLRALTSALTSSSRRATSFWPWRADE